MVFDRLKYFDEVFNKTMKRSHKELRSKIEKAKWERIRVTEQEYVMLRGMCDVKTWDIIRRNLILT